MSSFANRVLLTHKTTTKNKKTWRWNNLCKVRATEGCLNQTKIKPAITILGSRPSPLGSIKIINKHQGRVGNPWEPTFFELGAYLTEINKCYQKICDHKLIALT